MVILIGGVSCTGKTAMAQKLLETYKIPYLSIDHIKMGLIRGSQTCDFKATDSDDDITVKLWPIVKGIVMTAIENDQHLIIEGCYIPTDCLKFFEHNYEKEILSFFIGFSDHYLSNNFESGIIGHLREIENKVLDDYIQLDNFIKLHAAIKESCTKNHATYFEIDNDYLVETKAIYQWVDDKIKGQKNEPISNQI